MLSERALKILSEPAGFDPGPTPKMPRTREVRPKKLPRQRKPKPIVVEVVPIPCVDCGELRALASTGIGKKRLSGHSDRCEVCADIDRFKATIADPTTKTHKVTRCRRSLQRVLRDGRAYHPDAPHGTINGYEMYGCRCEACRESKSAATAHYGRPLRSAREKVAA